MLCVKTKLDRSPINGIGLFADQFIARNSVVWKYMPGFDILLPPGEISKLSPPAQEQFRKYAFLDTGYDKYMLCGDDGRFFNHSPHPNCDDSAQDITVALRDIKPGEELTVDYRTFYGDMEAHPEIAE